MKLRASLLSIALIALSACGGSSDSSSRNRNGLLDTTSVPGAGSSTVPGALTIPSLPGVPTTIANATTLPTVVPTTIAKPVATSTTLPMLIPVATSTTLPTLIPVATSTSTTVAPVTTVPSVVSQAIAKSFKDAFSKGGCGTGGMCTISRETKDKGPKGGAIIGVSEAGFATSNPAVANHFLEMGLPKKITSCNGLSSTNYRVLTSKASNSIDRTKELFTSECIRSADFSDDWYIPGDEEMSYVTDFLQGCRPSICSRFAKGNSFKDSERYLTSSTDCGLGSTFFYPSHRYLVQAPTCFTERALSGLKHEVWVIPVRSFGSTVRACAVGGPCKTGDIGPYGGIVLQTVNKPETPTKFFEALTSPEFLHFGPWCGDFIRLGRSTQGALSGRDSTEMMRNDNTSGLPCDAVLNQENNSMMGKEFFIPSRDELKLLCSTATTLQRLDVTSKNQCGLSIDLKSLSDPMYQHCPISVECSYASGSRNVIPARIDFAWSSTPDSPEDGLVKSANSKIFAWIFGIGLGAKASYSTPGSKQETQYNSSVGVTIPFREFTALLAK